MPVREAERDLGVDPRLLEPGARRQPERPRRAGDRGRRRERHRFDPQPRAVRACQLARLGGALEQRDRGLRRRTRLDHPVQRPQRRREHVQGAPVRGRTELRLAERHGLTRSAQRLLHPPLEVERTRQPDQQREPLGGIERVPEPQGPLELQAGLAQRPDALGVGGRQRAESARLRRQPRPLGMVREACVVMLPRGCGERRQHPRVQRRPTRRGDRHLDSLPGELVAKHEFLPVLDQHAAGERLLDGLGTARRDHGEQPRRNTLADNRGRVDDAARLRLQAPDPRERRITDRRGKAITGRQRLDHQERVAARQARELARIEPGRRRQRPNSRVRQPPQRQPPNLRDGCEVADQQRQRAVRGELVIAVGDDHHNARELDPAREQA